MSRLNSKLVLKALKRAEGYDETYEIVKTTNTLEYGRPGDTIKRPGVDAIIRKAEQAGARNKLTVEFIQ